jgi:tetratricopeptide (TPR) repeat protein
MALNRSKLAKAEKYAAQGKLQSAIKAYNKLLEENPDDHSLMNSLGDLHLRTGQSHEAVPFFQKSAETLEKQGFRSKAIAILRKAFRQAPSNAQIVESLAKMLKEEGLLADAKSILLDLAKNRRQLGENEAAKKLYRRVLELDPNHIQVYLRISEIAAEEGNIEEECSSYCAVARHLAKSARYEEAIDIIEEAYKSAPQNKELSLVLCDLLHKVGDADRANKILSSLAETHPNDLEVLVSLAELASEAGELDEADKLYLKAAAIDAKNEKVILLGSGIEIMRKDFNKAVVHLTPLVQKILEGESGGQVINILEEIRNRDPKNIKALNSLKTIYTYLKEKASIIRVLEQLSEAYETVGDFKSAIEVTEHLQGLEPESLTHKNRLEKLYSMSEGSAVFDDQAVPSEPLDLPETMDVDLEDFEDEDEDKTDPAINRKVLEADVFLRYGLTQKALDRLLEAQDISKNDAKIHQKIAEVHIEEENYAEAKAELEKAIAIYEQKGKSDLADDARQRIEDIESGATESPDLIINDEGIDDGLDMDLVGKKPEPEKKEAETKSKGSWVPSTDPLQGKIAEAEYYLEQNFISAAHHLISSLKEQNPQHPDIIRLSDILQQNMQSELDIAEVEKDLDNFFSPLESSTQEMIQESPGAIPVPKSEVEQKPAPAPEKPKAKPKPEPKPEPKKKPAPEPALPSEPEEGFIQVPAEDATIVRPVPDLAASAEQTIPTDDEGSAFLADIMEDLEEDLYAVRETAEKRLKAMEGTQIVNTERIMTHLSEEHLAAEALKEDAEKHFEMGVAYLETGLYEDAITDFQIAANDPIYYQRACLKLGICFLSKGMDDTAIDWLQKGITGGGDVEIMADSLHQLAIIYQIQGEMEAFKHAIAQLESLAPDHPGLETLKAVL